MRSLEYKPRSLFLISFNRGSWQVLGLFRIPLIPLSAVAPTTNSSCKKAIANASPLHGTGYNGRTNYLLSAENSHYLPQYRCLEEYDPYPLQPLFPLNHYNIQQAPNPAVNSVFSLIHYTRGCFFYLIF